MMKISFVYNPGKGGSFAGTNDEEKEEHQEPKDSRQETIEDFSSF